MMDILNAQFERGKADALALRNAAPTMTDAELIASVNRVPVFNPSKDYSAWNVGAPVKELVDGEYKVFRLLVPHNAKDYSGTPSALTELWSICVEEEPEPTWNEQVEAQLAEHDEALIDIYEMMFEI